MTFRSILVVILVLTSCVAFAQGPDDIVGKWQSEHGSGKIEIVKNGDFYHGKLIWIKEPNDETGKPKTDIHNPEKGLQDRPIIGLEVLKKLQYKGDGIWTNGKIYDPKSGNTYNCQVSLTGRDKLNVRAYFGLSIIGKTQTWSKIR